MSTSNFVPKIWAATIMRTLEDNLIAQQVCNTQFTGDIKKKGDTVYFDGLADPTISSYTGAAINYENLQDSRVALIVDQADMFAFKVGDIEKIQAEMDLKGSQAQRAAYGLKKACDTKLMGLYKDAGTTVTATSVTTANIFSFLGAFQQKLAEANVPESEMWMILPPWMKLKLTLAGIKFQIKNGINGTGSLAFTDEMGFNIYSTNQVANTGSIVTPISQIMAGSKNAMAFADQITESEDLRLQDTFDTAVRGLHTFGFKVVKPLELVTGAATYAAETTI